MTTRPARSRSLQLAGDFVGGLEVGAECRVLDVVLARRLAGVDVDRDESFRLVDHHVAAGRQRDGRRIEAVELALGLVAREQRTRVLVGLHVLGVARHQHLHEVFGFTVCVVALDDHLVDVLGIEIADGALDEAAFLIDEGRGLALERQVAHALPQAQQVVVVALDFGLGALGARGADDEAHALRHLDLLRHFLEAAAVARVGDLARDAAATRGVRHQHAITAGERKIGGESGTLVAALFLDDLHQDHLAALDHFLDLVLAALHLAAALRHFFHARLRRRSIRPSGPRGLRPLPRRRCRVRRACRGPCWVRGRGLDGHVFGVFAHLEWRAQLRRRLRPRRDPRAQHLLPARSDSSSSSGSTASEMLGCHGWPPAARRATARRRHRPWRRHDARHRDDHRRADHRIVAVVARHRNPTRQRPRRFLVDTRDDSRTRMFRPSDRCHCHRHVAVFASPLRRFHSRRWPRGRGPGRVHHGSLLRLLFRWPLPASSSSSSFSRACSSSSAWRSAMRSASGIW